MSDRSVQINVFHSSGKVSRDLESPWKLGNAASRSNEESHLAFCCCGSLLLTSSSGCSVVAELASTCELFSGSAAHSCVEGYSASAASSSAATASTAAAAAASSSPLWCYDDCSSSSCRQSSTPSLFLLESTSTKLPATDAFRRSSFLRGFRATDLDRVSGRPPPFAFPPSPSFSLPAYSRGALTATLGIVIDIDACSFLDLQCVAAGTYGVFGEVLAGDGSGLGTAAVLVIAVVVVFVAMHDP